MRVTGCFSIVFLFVFVLPAQGASVAIDSLCQTDLPDGTTRSISYSTRSNAPATGGCTLGTFGLPPTEPFSEALGGADFGVWGTESHPEAYLNGYVIHRAYQSYDAPYFFRSHASVSVTLDVTASSPGPPRPGQLLLMMSYGIDPDYGSGWSFLECQIEGLSGRFGFCPNSDRGPYEELMAIFPFSLGRPFNIYIAALGIGWGSTETSPSEGSARFDVRFQLQELDGTAVDVEFLPVPEPGTLLLLAAVLPILALRCMRRS